MSVTTNKNAFGYYGQAKNSHSQPGLLPDIWGSIENTSPASPASELHHDESPLSVTVASKQELNTQQNITFDPEFSLPPDFFTNNYPYLPDLSEPGVKSNRQPDLFCV